MDCLGSWRPVLAAILVAGIVTGCRSYPPPESATGLANFSTAQRLAVLPAGSPGEKTELLRKLLASQGWTCTTADKASSNDLSGKCLSLTGSPRSNRFVADLLREKGISLQDKEISLGRQSLRFHGNDLQLVFIGYNPENCRRRLSPPPAISARWIFGRTTTRNGRWDLMLG